MAMWFYDDAGEMEDFQTFQKDSRQLEKRHLELRVALRDAEAALRADPENDDLKARVKGFKERLEELEKRAPWITREVPIEIALWAPPHG